MDIGQLVVSLNADTAGLNAAAKDMRAFGMEASKYLTIPLTIVATGAFKTFKDYERTLAHITGLTDTSTEQTAAWSEQIKKMAVEMGKSPKELGEAMYFIASSGLEASYAMDVLKAATVGSVAGLGQTQKIADLVTSAMNAYGAENLNASYAVDVMTAAVREGKIEAEAMAGEMGYAIPIAAELGVSFDQVASGMAAMSTTGIEASTAATNLRQLLSDILKPAHMSEQALKKMGMTTDDLQKTLAKNGLLDTLEMLKGKTKEFGMNLAMIFPEVRALTGVLSLVGKHLEQNKKLFDDVKNSIGDTQKAYEVVTQTLDFKFNQAIAASQVALIELGDSMKGPLISIMNTFISGIQSLTMWYTSLSDGTQKLILYFGAFLAALGPVMLFITALTKSYVFLVLVVTKVAAAFRIMSAAMIANPITAVALGIAALMASYISWGNSIKDVTMAQRENNKIVQESNKIFANNAPIEQKMKMVETYSKRQLEMLQNQLITQLAAETDYTKQIESQLQKTSKVKEGIVQSDLEKQQSALIKNFNSQTEFNNSVIRDEKKRHEAQIKNLQDYLKKTQDLIKSQTGTTGTSPEILEIMSKMMISENNITTLQKALGYSFDGVGEKIKLYEKTIRDLIENGLDPADGYIRELQSKLASARNVIAHSHKAILDDYEKHLKNIKTLEDGYSNQSVYDKRTSGGKTTGGFGGNMIVPTFENSSTDYADKFSKLKDSVSPMKDLQVQLANLANLNSIFGDSFDKAGIQAGGFSDQIQLIMDRMKVLTDQGIRPGNDSITYMGLTLDQYIAKLQETYKAQNEMAVSAANMQTVYSGMANIFTDLTSGFGDVLAGAADAWDNMVTTILQGSQKIIETLLAQAIAAMIAGEASKGLIGLITAAIGVSALLAMWQMNLSKSKGAAKMKEGGIVPPGYPNDTYPTYLTSGEMVTPPGKLPQNSSINNNGGVVEFEIRGDVLLGILKKYNNKLQIY